MKSSVLSWIIVSIAFVASIITYPYMPELMAIHWDINTEINGTANKAFALLLLPALMVILVVILPKKQNFQQHKYTLLVVQNVILLVLLVLHSVTIAYGYGLSIDIEKVVIPMFGIILAIAGFYMPSLKHNSYIGIKTVNTITNEDVWKKTHKAASSFYIAGGLFMIASTFIGNPYQMFVFFGIIVIIVLASVFLSFHFGKEQH
ncbi:SdpI family protein [Paenibacillus sinopodophylli]|uniref:SdpI family protein n=1 Tax=Paenibacillus sinopodophylli TaxID=1837342 RepID=UPI00110CA1E6|nr:SdpI family protein [Paenibacillus sinopodophylli]